MTGLEAPVIAAIIGATASVAGTGVSMIASNNQAKKSAKAQAAYQKQLLDQQKATEASEKQARQAAADRARAYGESLLDGNSQLNNILTDSWDDEPEFGGSLIMDSTLQSQSDQLDIASRFV